MKAIQDVSVCVQPAKSSAAKRFFCLSDFATPTMAGCLVGSEERGQNNERKEY
jgi:hypothetical protein